MRPFNSLIADHQEREAWVFYSFRFPALLESFGFRRKTVETVARLAYGERAVYRYA